MPWPQSGEATDEELAAWTPEELGLHGRAG
jgi:hypothetical protein